MDTTENNQTSPLIPPVTWTKTDILLTTLAVLIVLGDSIETHLPGVITQQVSCELGASSLQENFLEIIYYFTMALTIFISAPINKILNLRSVLMLSMYSSIVLTVVCASVPNYTTMMLSRAGIGVGVGLNISTVGVFFVRHVSHPRIAVIGVFLLTLFNAVGSAWVSLLAWLFLDLIRWRLLILCASIPLFIPPVVILHCYSFERSNESHDDGKNVTKHQTNNNETIENDGKENDGEILANKGEGRAYNKEIVVSNPIKRIVKLSVCEGNNSLLRFCSIIMLPSVLRTYNQTTLTEPRDGEYEKGCGNSVYGNQFLVIAGTIGITNVLGRLIGWFLRDRITFRVLQISSLLIIMIAYITVNFHNQDIVAVTVVIGVGRLLYAIQQVELGIVRCDPEYFGTSFLQLGFSISIGASVTGGLVGTVIAAFCTANVVYIVTIITCVVQIALVYFMTEIQR